MSGTVEDDWAALALACRDSLVSFAETMHGSYQAARVHELLARKLEDCFARRIRRLCISLPPRHGKTLLASVMFPAWALTQKPGLQVISAGYSAELSESFSQATRAVLSSPNYQALFPPILNPNVSRSRNWQTLSGGTYFATGVGGGGLGRGADILLLDDTVKNREEADSPTQRARVWDWFTSTAMTRLSPEGVAIIIQSRWHEDDLIGRLSHPDSVRQLQEAGLQSEAFELLTLDAICESPDGDPLGRKQGEALWPERWPAAKLEGVKIRSGRRDWQSLYQQRPAPPGANAELVAKIRTIDPNDVPELLRRGRGWDLAVGASASGDYSCGALGGFDQAGAFYLVHMDRGRRPWPEQKPRIVRLAEADGGSKIGIETVSAWAVAAEEVRTLLAGKVRVESYVPKGSKEARAQPWLSMIDAGRFFVVRGSWNHDFLEELEQFPTGAHDDQVDAVTVLWELTRRHCDLVLA